MIPDKPPRSRLICMSLVVAGLLLIGPSALSQSAAVASETCLDCHDGYDSRLARTAHQLGAKIACADCHTGAEQHVEGPDAGNIGNPAKDGASVSAATCGGCHQPHSEQGMLGFDPHWGQDISCASCHKVHGEFDDLLQDDQAGFCARCHPAAAQQFKKRSNHPVADGSVTCLSCHDFTGAGQPDIGYGGNANCYGCHPQEASPYLFPHEAGSSFSTEGAGCVACHSPHGSSNERLLNQPDNRLCRQCHGVPPRHMVTHNGIGNSFQCIECHSEVHGSHDNGGLLDPMLGSKIGGGPGSCFCHNVSN
jgi:DmsE family decaheme c-type cytochrome